MGLLQKAMNTLPGGSQVYGMATMLIRSRSTPKRVKALIESGNSIRLDIGAGELTRPGWVTLDISEKSDLFWDLRKGIPFPNNSIDLVYSSHLLEHMPYEAGQALLDEAQRVLKPGGEISICVPNARIYIDAYVGARSLPDNHEFWEPALVSRDGLDLVNYIAYMGGAHACLFDQQSLLTRLTRAGFVDVSARSFDAEIDLPEREFESIYASARKAG